MRSSLIALSALVCPCIALAQTASVSAARITWFGIYQAGSERVVEDRTAPPGKRSIVTAIIPPRTNTDKVPAVLNTRFGFGYVLDGEPGEAVARIRHIRRFPPAGLFNPHTGQRYYTHEVDIDLRLDRQDLFVGYGLGRDFELVPGPWTFEVWHGERLLATKTFLLYKP